MTTVSNKCDYALRAIFELARQNSEEPKKAQEIAASQGIPPRFLEVILVELKNAGFVLARRGSSGGYVLARPAREITVGQVIRSFQGEPDYPATAGHHDRRMGDYAFSSLWKRVELATSEIYDRTTFEDLVAEETFGAGAGLPDYVI